MAGNGMDADAGTALSSRERIDRLLRRRPDRFGLYAILKSEGIAHHLSIDTDSRSPLTLDPAPT
jgi:hypothetical protein